jgi:hypothetical protein
MTDVNHRDTGDTKTDGDLLGLILVGGVAPQDQPLCVSVFSVSLWLAYVRERRHD